MHTVGRHVSRAVHTVPQHRYILPDSMLHTVRMYRYIQSISIHTYSPSVSIHTVHQYPYIHYRSSIAYSATVCR
jgi:hypothetical protein